MFALTDIHPGTVILQEAPIISLPKEEQRNKASSDQWIKTQFESLPDKEKQKVLELHDNINDESNCVGVYRTNAYMYTDNKQYESGLFLTISRINHSCFPNAQHIDNPKHEFNTIIALFGIHKGEEITHSYIDLDLFMSDCKARQKYIVDNYGFECKCKECVLFQKRDVFRKEYKELEDEMEKAFEEMNANKILKCSVEMVKMIKGNFNRFPPLLSQCYMKVAEAKLHLAEYEDVVDYMKRSARMDITYYGDDCDMNDIFMCKMMLPTKYQNTYPWDHVLGQSKPKK